MTLTRKLRALPLRSQLTLLLLTPCIVVLLLAGATMIGFQLEMFRREFARDSLAVADVVGRNLTAAITFDNAEDAKETLSTLAAKPHVISAALILPDGTVYATYGQYTDAPIIEAKDRFVVRERDAMMIKPVLLEGKQVATLNVVSDYQAVYGNLRELAAWTLLFVVLVGVGVGGVLSHRLQRLISDPVVALTRAARTVAEQTDYSIRVPVETGEEPGLLARTFNRMLTRIQAQDEALTQSRQKLDLLVNSIEGVVWECTADTLQFTFVSRQSERLLGYSPEQWLADVSFWQDHLHPEDAARAIRICRDVASAGQPYSYEYRMLASDQRVVWIRESGSVLLEEGKAVSMRGILQDITAEKEAANEVERLNRRLIDTSRQAGMAEVATGILHNVGNVLNSVSVSATLVGDRLKESKVLNLRRATSLLREQNGNLVQFLSADPKGRLLPEYLGTVADQLAAQQAEMLKEVGLLTQNIEHIKEIVAMQQSYARVYGAFEQVQATELLQDALRMNAAAFDRHRVEVVREFAPDLPHVNVDRHKVLQILINLLRNAKYAMDAGTPTNKRLVVRVEASAGGRVAIRVRDNGVGISQENLSRIFGHGFTTKRDGHGFGLHSGANAAKEMGGCLTAHSDGLGQGAEFTLELPVTRSEPAITS